MRRRSREQPRKAAVVYVFSPSFSSTCSTKFACSNPRSHIPASFLPAAWLEVESSSSAYQWVHLQSTSSWLPELRSLLLGGNNINGSGYAVLQTLANWRSLQTLDFSENALTGSVEDALAPYYYCDGSGGTGCGGNTSSIAVPLLRVLKLDGNDFTGLWARYILLVYKTGPC